MAMKTYLYQIFGWTVLLPTILFSESINDSITVTPVTLESVNTSENKVALSHDSSANTGSTADKVNCTSGQKKDKQEAKEDTVDASIIAKKLSKISTSFTTRLSKSRAQGYGGGVIISPMVAAIQMRSINELARYDYVLKRYTFSDLNDGYTPVLMTGGVAYGGVGKGLRIGLGGWGGEYKIISTPLNDSTLLLNVHQSFGGLLIERAFVKNNFNYLVGGMLGGGSIEVTKTLSNESAWIKVNEINAEKATATFAGLSLHSGFTVTLLPWMHVGLDVNSLFLLSVNGFNIPGCNGFGSVTPGMRLRIVLGNLG
jgi:hypothetical protein